MDEVTENGDTTWPYSFQCRTCGVGGRYLTHEHATLDAERHHARDCCGYWLHWWKPRP